MRVLIADDDRDIVEVLRLTFEGEGFDVAVAYDGVQTLSEIAASDPDILLLDVMMPLLDGLSVLAEVRARRSTSDLPVVVLTGARELFDRFQTPYRTRYTQFMSKPFEPFTVVDTVVGMLKEVAQASA